MPCSIYVYVHMLSTLRLAGLLCIKLDSESCIRKDCNGNGLIDVRWGAIAGFIILCKALRREKTLCSSMAYV
jgi:hypothetical protein